MLQFRRSLCPAALRSALRSAPPVAPPLAGRASCPLVGRARFASAASSAASSGGGRLAVAGLAATAAAAAGYGAWQLQVGAGEDEAVPLSGGGGGGGVPEASLTRRQLEAIYTFEKRIGQGGFGDVWLARDAKSGRQVAVKLISLEKLPRAMVEVEVEAMRRCGSHPYIIELLGVYWVRPEGRAADSGPVEAAIVMELAGGGGLFERLVAEGAYTEQIASKIIKQVALSIYHLHSRGILHRDLKPENVVFECEERDSAIKLIDFGTAVTLDEAGEKVQGGGRIGTWSYWAPEQLAQQPYGFEVDLWSLGVLLYILLVGFHPFDPEGEANEQQILANMKAHRLCLDAPEWGTVSGQAKGLVVSLLEPDPEQRLTAAQLISHPWVLGQDVPGRPMPATQERLRHFTQARNAFYGSLLMGLLVHQLSTSADAEGLGGLQVDVVREGWRALDRDGKGHIDAQDLWRVCLDMGYKVSPKDVDQMVCVLAPTGLEKKVHQRYSSPRGDGKPAPEAGGGGGSSSGGAEGGGGGGGGPARISYERYCKTLAGSFSRTFAKGAYVFKEGDPVDAFFVITSGACEVRVAGPDGKERLIATLGAGDFFGETGLLEGRSVRAASVFATAPLEVLAIDRKVFNEVASVHNSSALSTSMRERAEARQRARLLKVFENMSVSLSQRRRFGKGAVVYQQGSPAQLFYIVNEGELEMSVNKPDGGSVRVKTLRPGDHLGYDAIFSEVHDTTVTCLSEVELTEVTKEVLGDAFSNDRYFSTIFEARQQLREGQLAAASQGEAQILPMMARAAAAGDGVDYSQYESLIKEMAPLEVSHGEAIFQQGDPPEQVYFVSEGQLECEYDPKLDSRAKKRRPSGEAVVGRDGKPRVVATLGPGDHFGETAMLEARKARNLTVRCVTASCVLRAMSMARFSEILRQRPELHFTVQRAAQMRTNQRIRNVVASAADEDLRVLSFAPGETIFRQGDPSDSFYVLESGEVEMSLVPASEDDEPSAPVPVRTCTAGETFGASGLLPGDNVRRNTATAQTPVVVKVMPVKLFKAMVREDGFLQAGLKASGSYVEARAVSELDETLDAEVQKAMAR